MKFGRQMGAAILLAATVLLLTPDTAQARPRPHNRVSRPGRGRGGASSQYMRMMRGAASQQAAAQRAAAQRAAAIAAANAQVKRAELALHQTKSRLENQFNRSSETVAATRDQRATNVVLAKERQRALDGLKNNPEYKAAMTRKNELHEQAQKLRDSGGSKEAFVQRLRQETEAGSEAIRIEAATLRADPAYERSLKSMQAAAQHLDSLKQQFKSSITKNSDWLKARKTLDQAESQRIMANAGSYRPTNGSGRTARPSNRKTRSR